MSRIKVETFDMAQEIGTSYLHGEKLGQQVHALLRERISLAGKGVIWKVDYSNAAIVDYRFVSSLLGPFLDDHFSGLDTGIYFVASCRHAVDLEHTIRGLSWRHGTLLPPSAEQIDRIRTLGRYLVLLNSGKFEYIGTIEGPHLAILRYMEEVDSASHDDMRKNLELNSSEVVDAARELCRRRQILLLEHEQPGTHQEPTYASIASALREIGE